MANEDDADISALARSHAPRAIEVLANLVDNALEDKDQIRAAEAILDRGYGKPSQAIIAIPATRRQALAAAAFNDEQLVAIIERKQLPRIGAPQPMVTIGAKPRGFYASSHGPGDSFEEIDPLLL
jgi:hypothetical protein